MSHPDQALDSAVTYHLHVHAGLRTVQDYRTAAALADEVANVLFTRAADARTASERRMWLLAATKARVMRDGHTLAAEVAAIGEQVIGR